MVIVEQSFEILTPICGVQMLKHIELAGRTCYKSESKITANSYKPFIKMLVSNKHGAMLEHSSVSVKFITNRAITHEIVRHRHFAYAQSSTRYVKLNALKLIKPLITNKQQYNQWLKTMQLIEDTYTSLLKQGVTTDIARDVLPNATQTELIVTGSLRQWQYFFELRTSKQAHKQLRQLLTPCLTKFKQLIPIVFDNIIGVE